MTKRWRFVLFLLLLSLLLSACASPLGPRGAAGAGSPAGPVVAISGPIVDATTGAAVVADVYVDGKLTLSKTDRLELAILLQRDRQTEIRVVAPGSEDWAVAVQGGGTRQLSGPVRMKRKP